MPALPESTCESEGTVDAVTELCVRIQVEECMCVYVGLFPCLQACVGARTCVCVASSPLSTEGNVGLILLKAITPFSQQIAFVPGLFSTAGNEEGRFIININ